MKKKNNNNTTTQKKEKSKASKKTTTGTTTRTMSVETGSSFPPPSVVNTDMLDNALKCLTVANLVRSFAHNNHYVEQVIRYADLISGGNR